MPTVEKVNGGRVLVRGIGRFAIGDRAEVSEADAAYLCDARGDFELVDDSDLPTEADETGATVADAIEAGHCPWCDEYEGDAVPQHATTAHPEEWSAYREA